MNKPNITWYARVGNEKYTACEEFYAGTHTIENKISVDIQIWNNRWGTEDVESLSDFVLNMYFDNFEDSVLFQCCEIIMNDSDKLTLIISDHKATISFPNEVILSGVKNDGTSANNKNNFISLTFNFSAPEYRLKENDLKSLYFEIIQQ